MGRCTNEDAGPRRGWIMRSHVNSREETSASENTRPRMRWIVRSHIGQGGRRNILYKCVETSPKYILKTKLESESRKNILIQL